MLSIFPIQFLSLFAYFILRLFVGSILLYLGIKHFSYRKELQQILKFPWFPYSAFIAFIFPLTELLLASLILVGAYTQLAALIMAIMSIKMLILHKYFTHHTIPNKIFYVLLLGVSLLLIITGAGIFAFDLPF